MRPTQESLEITPYTCDGLVLALTGDEGDKNNGSDTALCSKHPGYYKEGAGVWALSGINYVGTGGGALLNYEGHLGVDYRAAKGALVYSAAAGTAKYSKKIVGAQGAYSKFHTLAIIPDIDPTMQDAIEHIANTVKRVLAKKFSSRQARMRELHGLDTSVIERPFTRRHPTCRADARHPPRFAAEGERQRNLAFPSAPNSGSTSFSSNGP
jgi:hypothetical protein